jgi:hypothetical protein
VRRAALVVLAAASSAHAESAAGKAVSMMIRPRVDHAWTLLQDGRVAAIGGSVEANSPSESRKSWATPPTVDLYDPASGAWKRGKAMGRGRAGHTATVLADGRVLVTGGAELTEGKDGPIFVASSSELWDPRRDTWSASGALAAPRDQHTATLLTDGCVLVAGGQHQDLRSAVPDAELFEARTAKFGRAGALATPRILHAAVPLARGRAAVVGGTSIATKSAAAKKLASIEIWDPATKSWSPGPSLTRARASMTATALPDGKILVVGGSDERHQHIASAELCDLDGGKCVPAGSLATARSEHIAVALPDGRVVVAGGWTGTNPATPDVAATAEVWNGAAWKQLGRVAEREPRAAAVVLSDGTVLISGGHIRCQGSCFRAPHATVEQLKP